MNTYKIGDKTSLSEDPKVFTISNFITPEECQHMIDISKDNLKIALVSEAKQGRVSDRRTGKNCWIKHDHDKITKKIGNRIAAAVGIPLDKAEAFQIIYYDKTQEYYNHYDGWVHNGSDKSIRCMKFGGQRLQTALCYLNTVEEGGETRFTRLNVDVKAEKGKLLVFSNVKGDTNIRHPLTEHCGRPVIAGEKWAFNLWFREENRQTIVYDPKSEIVTQEPVKQESVEKNSLVDIVPISTSKSINVLPNEEEDENFKIKYSEIPNYPFVKMFDNAVNDLMIEKIMEKASFPDKSTKKISWLKNEEHPVFIDYVQKLTKCDKSYFESICVIQYPCNFVHNRHFDAFEEDRLQKEIRGQRVKTITGFFDDGFVYSFPESKIENFKELSCKKGSFIVYNNTFPETLIRDKRLLKSITNTQDKCCYLFHIYVREKMRKVNVNSVNKSLETKSSETKEVQEVQKIQFSESSPTSLEVGNIEELPVISENFLETLNETYVKAEEKTLCRKGLKSLSFSNIKTQWTDVVDTINLIQKERVHGTILNEGLLDKDYVFDEFTPCIVNNAILPSALKLIQDYVQRNINNGSYPLGDRQSNRFKTIDDPINRILHFELLPLIEKITGEKLKPSYTYLSCYLNDPEKDTALPAHTDRCDASRTVSFIMSKPEGSYWPIYFHKKKQPVKNKGRWHGDPISKDECVECDCDAGGFMIFMGEDHLHFREQITCDYYNVVLLHYVKID